VPTLPQPGWVVRFAQIRSFWWSRAGGGSRLEPEGIPYIFYEHITKMRLSTADWRPRPQRGSAPGPRWGTSVPRMLRSLCPSYLETLATPLICTTDFFITMAGSVLRICGQILQKWKQLLGVTTLAQKYHKS